MEHEGTFLPDGHADVSFVHDATGFDTLSHAAVPHEHQPSKMQQWGPLQVAVGPLVSLPQMQPSAVALHRYCLQLHRSPLSGQP